MNLHIAPPRTGIRRQVKGSYLAVAAGVLIMAGATAGAISLKSTMQDAKPARESVVASQVTTLAGARRSGTMGSYAEYVRDVGAAATFGSAGSASDHMGGYAEFLSAADEQAGAVAAASAGVSWSRLIPGP